MKYLLALILLLHGALSIAADPALQEPALSRFREAVEAIDGYRGETASLELAHANLREVLKANPDYAPAYREMARYFILKDDQFNLASSMITKAIWSNPDYAEAFVLRGHLYRLMGRHDEAVEALKTAEKLGTNDPWLHNNWADLLIDEQKYEEAAKRYRIVIDKGTTNRKALLGAFEGLIKYYTAIGKLDEADKMYKKQIKVEPHSAWGYGNYAAFLFCQRDDYEGAIIQSRKALSIMDYGNARFWLAAGLYRRWAQDVIKGHPKKGKPHFMEAMKIVEDFDYITSRAPVCKPLEKLEEARVLVSPRKAQ